MTEASVAAPPIRPSLLDDVAVKKPEHSVEKTRKYLCGIRQTKANVHLEFQIGIGPATFCTSTYIAEGSGADSKQIYMPGAIKRLSESQVAEIREKIKFLYYRENYHGTGEHAVLTGITIHDVSDSGGVNRDKETGAETRRPPVELLGKSAPNDKPLKDLVFMELCVEDAKILGRVITREQAVAAVAAFDAEDGRKLEGVDAEFETGAGGKAAMTEAGRKAANEAMESLAKRAPKGKGDGQAFGAGRLPEGK